MSGGCGNGCFFENSTMYMTAKITICGSKHRNPCSSPRSS
jgi:hypothetical protein